jgi:putative glutamine amidotransferase
MPRRAFPIRTALLALSLSLAAFLPAQTTDRYLDTAPADHEDVRLIIFHPEPYNVRSLKALRDNGILDIPNLTVVGVYHVRQRSPFADSKNFVRTNGLDWFKFHAVDAEISEPVLYRRNACTPEFETIFGKADGIIFFGGPDLPPSVYGEKTNLFTEITDPYRHFFESSAVFHLLGGLQDPAFPALLDSRPEFPLLGICLGLQTLNAGTGGTLIQDIWSEAYAKTSVEDAISLGPEQWHTNPYRRLFPLERLIGSNFHSLQLGSQSVFCRAMGFKAEDHPRILSSHHQALEKLGKGLVPTATSRDGKIIEAVEHKKYPNVLGVQFHPEHYMLWDAEPGSRLKPGDPPTSYLAILEGAPPSLEFHKRLWGWFAEKLVENHGTQSAEKD